MLLKTGDNLIQVHLQCNRCDQISRFAVILLLAVPKRLFGDLRCGVLLYIIIFVIYKYINR